MQWQIQTPPDLNVCPFFWPLQIPQYTVHWWQLPFFFSENIFRKERETADKCISKYSAFLEPKSFEVHSKSQAVSKIGLTELFKIELFVYLKMLIWVIGNVPYFAACICNKIMNDENQCHVC